MECPGPSRRCLSASFAAVPHVVAALATNPTRAPGTYFPFPAWVEICRRRKGVEVPDDLILDYRRALRQLPSLVAAAAEPDWDADFLPCALSAIAASKDFPTVAEAALDLSPPSPPNSSIGSLSDDADHIGKHI